MSNLLLVSSGTLHPTPLTRMALRQALTDLADYSVRRIRVLEELPQVDLEACSAVVLFFHRESVSQAALDRLESYVAGGGGLFAVHAAAASFMHASRYHALLGGRFRTHGPVEAFQVHPVESEDPVFGAVPVFSVQDELYRHEYDPAVRVHFYTVVAGEQEPVVWTRTHGKGRVGYLALGHTPDSLRHPAVVQIIRRGVSWVGESGE